MMASREARPLLGLEGTVGSAREGDEVQTAIRWASGLKLRPACADGPAEQRK